MSGVGFVQPWWLLLSLLALLPLLRRRQDEQVFGWTALLPPDPAGRRRQRLEKALAVAGLLALALGLAGIGLPQTVATRQGSGAEILVLLDRSASMDAALVARGEMPRSDKYAEPKKRKIARSALAKLAAGRPHDVFALMMFSINQFQVLPFNSQPEMVQAAIQAVHSEAPSAAATDWPQIVRLYDHLLELDPSPVVALHRAVAVAEVDGPEAGLRLVDAADLPMYHLFHAIRADLLRRLDRTAEAAAAYEAAIALTENAAEKTFLRGRLGALNR